MCFEKVNDSSIERVKCARLKNNGGSLFPLERFLVYNSLMELLAPAGNLEKLKTAVRFGADAVYCGAGAYSLRVPEASLTPDELAEGISFAHEQGRRVYLAMNIFPFDEDFAGMLAYFKEAVAMGIDAVIVSDSGLFYAIRRLKTGVEIHLSTQANTTNSESVRFWKDQGVSRIILARELSLDRIRSIKQNVPGMGLEIFGHGAMCVAFSGRCLLSSLLTGRSANRGLCTQPCRWEYRLQEADHDEEPLIHENERGTYILNSRDLCMIEHLPALAEAGVDGLKIEGRMKTAYYVAAVTRVYRAAIDRYKDPAVEYALDPRWQEELDKIPHRPYTTGFYFPNLAEETEYTSKASPIRNYDFVGTVDHHNIKEERLKILARNRFSVGDVLEILDPACPDIIKVQVRTIIDERTGNSLQQAHNSYIVQIPFPCKAGLKISEHAVIRARSRDNNR